MMRRERACAALVAATLAALIGGAAAEADPGPSVAATTVVQQTIDAVLAVLRDSSLTTPQKRERIEAIAYERFDFPTISKLILARNWKKLSPQQRDDFRVEFKRHLSLTYGKNLENYGDEEVTIEEARVERNGDVTVRTAVEHGAEPIRVDYRLRSKDGPWRMIDVIIDGVSLLANFRTQTQEIISQDGPDGLIDKLRAKNAEREAEAEAG